MEAGIYFKGKNARYAIGLTYTSFDPFTRYRRVNIAGSSIAKYVSQKSALWELSLKISVVI
jgi:hypothetical protein